MPIPDGYVNGHKVFDASYVNSKASTIRDWQRWFYYILIALYGMNNGYKLIRGGSVVGGGKDDSK